PCVSHLSKYGSLESAETAGSDRHEHGRLHRVAGGTGGGATQKEWSELLHRRRMPGQYGPKPGEVSQPVSQDCVPSSSSPLIIGSCGAASPFTFALCVQHRPHTMLPRQRWHRGRPCPDSHGDCHLSEAELSHTRDRDH